MKKNLKYDLPTEGKLILQLYVCGMSARSMEAIENIRKICNTELEAAFDLEIVDLYKNPERAAEQQIIFSPSLIKQAPPPKKTLVGTFADPEKVIRGLGIRINNNDGDEDET